MPIFDYKCTECSKVWESLQFGGYEAGERPSPCPHCGCEKTEKQITGSVSFSIKGPGTYDPGFSSSKSNKRRRKP